jgi:uncharacterized protein (TIGR02118 family)
MEAPTPRRTLDLLAERGALLSEPALAAQKPRGPEIRTPRANVEPLELTASRTARQEAFVAAHLLVLYPHPTDAEEFDRTYREEHLPYAGPRLEGATGVVTKRIVGPAFAPPPYHLISDVSFPTIDALRACAGSAAGKEALTHAASISSGGAPMVVAVIDDDQGVFTMGRMP